MSLTFTGYAAIWDRMDRAGDVMRRGAFAGAGFCPWGCLRPFRPGNSGTSWSAGASAESAAPNERVRCCLLGKRFLEDYEF